MSDPALLTDLRRRTNPITVDPAVLGGSPCIGGTRVPAELPAGCVWAGDSVESVADDYGISREDVLLSCWWYVREGYLPTKPRDRLKQWRAWSDVAHSYFARSGQSVLCGPDEFEYEGG